MTVLLFNTIWQSLVDAMGSQWAPALLLTISIFVLMMILTQEIVISLIIATLPITLLIILGYFFAGWAVAFIVLVYGYVLNIGIKRITQR